MRIWTIETVGRTLGRVISSAARPLPTLDSANRRNADRYPCLEPSVWMGVDISWIRQRGQYDWLKFSYTRTLWFGMSVKLNHMKLYIENTADSIHCNHTERLLKPLPLPVCPLYSRKKPIDAERMFVFRILLHPTDNVPVFVTIGQKQQRVRVKCIGLLASIYL